MRLRSTLVPLAALLLTLGTSASLAQPASEASPSKSGATTSRDAGPSTNRPAAGPTGNAAQGTATRAGEAEPTRYAGIKDADRWERTHRASRMIGTDVVNRQGEKIGDIEDIVFDGKGTIAYAVISTGDFLGISDRLHAVPWQSIQTNTGRDNFILDIDRDRLKSAPGFDRRNWPNLADDKWNTENSRHFPRPNPSPGTSSPAR
jgi:sporulation protein YlmC with PRC-barrel domain